MGVRWRGLTIAVAVMAMGVGAVACEPEGTGDEAAEGGATFTATEFAYAGPDTIPAGRTELTLKNDGKQSHALILLGPLGDKTMDDVGKALSVEGPPEAWMKFPGGITGVEAGQSAGAVLDLEPGSYAMLSFDSGEDQVPDVAKGMLRQLTVTEAAGEEADEPEAAVSIEATEFSFDLDGAMKAGRQTIRIENVGEQVHEAAIMRLAEGKTAGDLVEMLSSEEPPAGPPPVTGAGGMGPLDPGKSGFATVDLEPGNYVFLCFVPDTADGAPHAAKGMVHEFTVE